MSAPHRGLPPPAAMGLAPQQPTSTAAPPQPVHQSHSVSQQPPPPPTMPQHSHVHSQTPGHLPPPPQQWQGGEESMKSWLAARAEEEKTKQEEAKIRQEELRLEQRRIEGDILRSSLSGGIPPALIPLVFAGMGNSGGAVSKAAFEWAQQYLTTSSQGHHPQLLPAAQVPVSPDHQRDFSSHTGAPYGSSTSGPGAGPQAQGGFAPHAGSPTRPRGQTLSGPLSRAPSGLSSFSSGGLQPGPGHSAHQPNSHGHAGPGQQEQALFFHHWQPPGTHGGSTSNPPGTPSGEVARKRKAPGSQPSSGGASDMRLRSPPLLAYSNTGDLASSRRGHKRQRSDMSWRLSSPGQGDWREQRDRRRKSLSPQRESTARMGRTVIKGEGGGHSVSSLLSADPEMAMDQYHQMRAPPHHPRQREQESQEGTTNYPRHASEHGEDVRRTPPTASRRDDEHGQGGRPE
ncbi:hypothetical protein NLU13_3332 [Sarocladium strictum]|uniref:Uncharacterized protein n=1 Tax=Sarocladium strictum TaxID=5046 RepID=A0AA39GML9_SARSR|nr:hypothetical protein NLU13_3332 [Sarocladium strictum]